MVGEVSVAEWVECIDELVWIEGVELFKVEEEVISKTTRRTFILRGFEISEEEELCVCNDYDNILLSNSSMLSIFSIDTAKILKHDKLSFELLFHDGIVCLKGIIE